MTELLTPASDDLGESEAKIFVSPEEARAKLESLGYTEDTWSKMLADETGSHYTRALVQVAGSTEPQDWNMVYHDIKPEIAHYSEGDNLAEIAARNAAENGAWEAFAAQHPDMK